VARKTAADRTGSAFALKVFFLFFQKIISHPETTAVEPGLPLSSRFIHIFIFIFIFYRKTVKGE
jgi:hypothetical protein